jgi:hypothetical protein
LEALRGCAVGTVLAQGALEEVGRVLDLAIAQFVRATLPFHAHPESLPVRLVEANEHHVHAREVRVLVALGETAEHADEQGAHRQLARPHPEGQGRFEVGDGLGESGLVEQRFDAGERLHRRWAPSRATATASSGASRWATRSPRRWVQVTPAASMKAARPIASAMATR